MKQTTTILIVDDEPTARDMLEMLLANQGYELASASNGLEALKLAAELIPDVILLDVMMPEMDGFEVCEHIRADPILAGVPVLMVTALDDRDSRLQGIEAGADDFISKPYDRFELRARLKTITKLNRYRRLLNEQVKFEWVIEKTDDAFLILDKNEKIIYTNPQARLYLSTTDIQANTKFLELARQQYHCEPQDAWANGLIYTDESFKPRYLVRPESARSHAFWLQAEVMEMGNDSEEKYLIRLRDVTQNISSERVRWTFQGQINHKLRSPLMPITSGLEYLKNNVEQLSEPQLKEFLDVMHQGSVRLQSEIEEILKFLNISQVDKLAWDNCNLNDIGTMVNSIAESLEIESVNLQSQGIENQNKIPLFISRRAVELILTELFSNAKKFHPQHTPNLDIQISKLPEGICLQVIDDGTHLSPDQLSNLWTSYYQAEKDFTGQLPGMGLGLAMVSSLVWNVGGKCRAFNREDKNGLVIEIIFPLMNVKD
jgi:DNA-binding response OmpR family regulator/anti-sigma regulatory factor (Ser/Thr protein kinase)